MYMYSLGMEFPANTISPRKKESISCMNISVMKIKIFIFSLSTILFSASSSKYNFPINKPNCVDRCGDEIIPYPSGTTPECYHHPVFWVTCNHSFDPPRLFWQNSSQEMWNISLDGQATMKNFVVRDCYAPNGTRVQNMNTTFNLPPTHITFDNTATKITMVGCDGEATASGLRKNGRKFRTGCSAMCESKDDLKQGSCMGLGCCQTSFPDDVSSITVEISSYSNYTNVSDFNNCRFAFVVDESAFRFYPENLTNLMNVTMLPLVMNWVIGTGTCAEAQANSSSYACVSPHSSCYEPENGYGYRCRCNPGFEGNPYLINGCQDIDECANASENNCTKNDCKNSVGSYRCACSEKSSDDVCNNDKMSIPVIIIGIVFGIMSLLLVVISVNWQLKRRSLKRMKQKYFLQNGGMLLQEKLTRMRRSTDTVKIYSSSDLQTATKEFHNSMIIGQGGFGTVYKGLLPDNRVVAIKRSKRVDPNQTEQFINEVFVLSQVNHKNVVKLLGCCLETEVPLLVYEFINNGTLSAHIHNQAKAHFLRWEMRLKIAAETAGVLSYLHSAASTPIIHRDVKSDNILLDQTFTAKVSDFGASKLVPLDLTQLSTMVQGTFGYLDPEYMQTNHLTEKSDVYSFGVVLLELLTGRKAISFNKPEEEKNLANYFLYKAKQNCLREILDVNVYDTRNMEQISEVARLAKGCLKVRGEDRPTMKEVATELERLILGGKQSWARIEENAEEMESLLGKTIQVNHSSDGEGNSGTNVGYDSIGYDSLMLSGGR